MAPRMAGRFSSLLFRVLRLWPLRALVALAAPALDRIARTWILTKRNVLDEYVDLVPKLAWDVFKDGRPEDRERLFAFLCEWYSDHPAELEALLAVVLPRTAPDGRRRAYERIRQAAGADDSAAGALASEYARATDAETAKLAAALSEPLIRDGTGERLELVLEAALAAAPPRLKQRFYARIEERAAHDEHALAYAERVFERMRVCVERHGASLAGLRVLELGPGHTLATGVLFYVHGARSYTAVDYYPIAGRDAALYARLREHLAAPVLLPVAADAAREQALRRFDEAVRLSGTEVAFDESKVACRHPVDAAQLPFPDASFDLVFSTASFEHFKDPIAAVRECARVTAPGGLGLHQIDLRDHRDFARPLDFLRFDESEWAKLHELEPFCYTNRLRKSDFERAFSDAGLALAQVTVNLRAPVDPSLRAALHPRYRDRAPEDLEALSAFFVVRKPEAPALLSKAG